MVTVCSIRNRASPQELRSQELGRRKAGLERGRRASMARPSGDPFLRSLPVRFPTHPAPPPKDSV